MKGKGKAKGKRQYKTKCPSLDRISNLPSSIIENILCLVPIKDAVRTSILSKDWRYNWTKIPKLVFDLDQMFDENQLSVLEQLFGDWSSEKKQLMRRCKQFFAIYQVLLMHQGPILEFSFSMTEPDDKCVEIEQIIILLSRNNNTVKKFTFEITSNFGYSGCELPRSIFMLCHLTDLRLENCTLKLVPTFDGFGSLKSLILMCDSFSEKALLGLLANCPALKSLTLELDSDGSIDCINIIELFKCLPVVEDLVIKEWIIHESDVPPELPTKLAHLKCFYFDNMTLYDNFGLKFLLLVIRSSPKLENLVIYNKLTQECHYLLYILRVDLTIGSSDSDDEVKDVSDIWTSYALKECSDIWLEHLKDLVIRGFANKKHEMEFVKLILAKAPVLKKVMICCCYDLDEESEIVGTLLGSPCVSPFAENSVKDWRSSQKS